MKKLIQSNILLIISIIVFAIILSEILVYVQLQLFSIQESNNIYAIGFWTPLIDSFFVILLVLYFKSVYEKELKAKNAILQDVQSIAKLGEWHYDFYNTQILLSKESMNLLGLQINGKHSTSIAFQSMLEKNDWKDLKNRINICLANKKDFQTIYKTIQSFDDKVRWFELRGHYLLREKSIVGTIQDITENQLKERKISQYVTLIDKNIITSTTDLAGTIIDVSEAFCSISGYTKEELIGKKHNIVRHPDMPPSLYRELWETISNNNTWKGEIKNSKKDKSYYWVKAIISPIFDTNGKKIGYTAIREDITDKKRIEELSVTDDLTGLYNKRYFNELFPKVIRSAKRGNTLICFVMMDVDYFKQYNDTYGHQLGDKALAKVAQSILSTMNRADDYCFRLGGEEFGVVFKAEEPQKAYDFADLIRQRIENLKIEHNKSSIGDWITVSMGVVCQYAKEIKNEEEIYRQADSLLYQAKHLGRNRVVY